MRRLASDPHVVLAAGAVAVLAAEYLFRTRGNPYGFNTEKPAWLLVEPAAALVALAYAWRAQDRLRLAPLLGLAVGFHLLWLAVHVHLGVPGDQDTDVYRLEGISLLHGHYPRSEYPPGGVVLFALESWLHRSAVHTANAFVMVPFQLAIVGSVWSLRTRFSAWLAALVALWPMSAYWWEFRFDLVPAALLALGLALALWGIWTIAGMAWSRWLSHDHPASIQQLLPRGGLEALLWVTLSVSAGICEEFVFRGYLLRQFEALSGSRPIAVVAQAVLFGISHGYQGVAACAHIAAYGILFGWFAVWRGSLRPGMIAHAWTDIAAGLLGI